MVDSWLLRLIIEIAWRMSFFIGSVGGRAQGPPGVKWLLEYIDITYVKVDTQLEAWVLSLSFYSTTAVQPYSLNSSKSLTWNLDIETVSATWVSQDIFRKSRFRCASRHICETADLDLWSFLRRHSGGSSAYPKSPR